jgi:tRNA1Val (adenine37-N6)-methyltransferase
MPQSYFRFKEFTIQQERCTMKVCTDSCILGAWTALRLGDARNILDIGTGTGLLPLMLSQKTASPVDTIESDAESACQAMENIRQSPWAARIRVLQGDARIHSFDTRYDFIITNPPFFESDLHSPLEKKNKAKHDQSLTLEQLMEVIGKTLNPGGMFSILLPFQRCAYFEKLASTGGFSLWEKLNVRQTPAHPFFRSVCLFGYSQSSDPVCDELSIKNDYGKNSSGFSRLICDYY